jgi:hypothetical protein
VSHSNAAHTSMNAPNPNESQAELDKSLSSYDESSDVTGTGTGEEEAPSVDSASEVIGKQETREVFRQKLVVMAVLLCSCIGVATSVYVYVSRNEQDQFERKCIDDFTKVFNAIGNRYASPWFRRTSA